MTHLHQYPDEAAVACCAPKAGDPSRLPFEYVLDALAESNAEY